MLRLIARSRISILALEVGGGMGLNDDEALLEYEERKKEGFGVWFRRDGRDGADAGC